MTDFYKGDFLLEYHGVLTKIKEAKQKELEYIENNKGSYMFYFRINGHTLW